MSKASNNQFPRLRPLDFRPVTQDGRQTILLRDPLQLSDQLVAVPRQLAPVLALCDGTVSRSELQSALIARFQLLVGNDILDRLIEVCDEALLLDNERFQEALAQAKKAYREAPFRPPALAGQSYPDDPRELRDLLDEYLAGVDGTGQPGDSAGARGLVSPHIDYDRGGPVYAQVWQRAKEMVRAADLAIILGTDHYGEGNLLTLTRQSYATPCGTLPTATGIVDSLAAAIGEEAAFAGEFHHRNEHSIELAAVWLHHMRGGRPCELVPILCGGYSDFVEGKASLEEDRTINATAEILRQAMAGRQAIVVAAGDLSHVGPAFGGQPLGIMERARLRVADDAIIAQMCAGDAQGFFSAIQQAGDRNNVCGLPPIYLALRILSPVQGERVAYDRCPADDKNTSFVSIGGVIFR
jgi:MEMO1 family protein